MSPSFNSPFLSPLILSPITFYPISWNPSSLPFMSPSFNSPFVSPLIVFNFCDPTVCLPWISLLQFHSLNFPPVNSFLQFLSHISISEVFLQILSPKFLAPLFHLLEFFTHNFSSPFWSMLKLLLLSTLGCGTLRISHILLKVRSLVASLQFLAKGTCGKSPTQEQ